MLTTTLSGDIITIRNNSNTEAEEVKEVPKIKEVRKRLGLSASELARRVGIAPSYVILLESGARKNPSRSVMQRMAEALGTTVKELFFEEG